MSMLYLHQVKDFHSVAALSVVFNCKPSEIRRALRDLPSFDVIWSLMPDEERAL